MRLHTVGHGTLDQPAFGDLLVSVGIERVVDVRRFPGSRRHPHVNRGALAVWLPDRGVDYRWAEELGGRRRPRPDSRHVGIRNDSFRAYADHMDTTPFRDALERLLQEGTETAVAVMCAEAVWWRCHRRLVADAALLLHDVEVQHVMHDGSLQLHRPTAAARVVGGRLRYDGRDDEVTGSAQPPLFGG